MLIPAHLLLMSHILWHHSVSTLSPLLLLTKIDTCMRLPSSIRDPAVQLYVLNAGEVG